MYNKSVLSRCLQFNTFKLNFIGSLSFSHFRMYIKYSHFTQLNFFVNTIQFPKFILLQQCDINKKTLLFFVARENSFIVYCILIGSIVLSCVTLGLCQFARALLHTHVSLTHFPSSKSLAWHRCTQALAAAFGFLLLQTSALNPAPNSEHRARKANKNAKVNFILKHYFWLYFPCKCCTTTEISLLYGRRQGNELLMFWRPSPKSLETPNHLFKHLMKLMRKTAV